MRSYVFCPVSDKRIDEHAARINGALTFLLLGVFAITGSVIPVIFLAGDFFLRAFNFGQYSILAVSSRNIIKYLQINQNLINAGPKIFAARIGLLLSSIIVIPFLLNLPVLAYSVAGILAFFSFLESALGLCVACEIYPFLYKFLYKVR
jgi:hypothetical protein